MLRNRMFSLMCINLALCLISASISNVDATVCAPLSRFKIDCNTCYCSVDGRRYTCTKRFCSADVGLNFNGYVDDEPAMEAKSNEEEPKEDWDQFLNDLALNYDDDNDGHHGYGNGHQWAHHNDHDHDAHGHEDDGNQLDYGDYLKDDTEYIGSLKRGWRF